MGHNTSAYFVFSFVLKPHINELLDRHDQAELQRIFTLLEFLANNGDAAVQNELRVTMEEMDRWRVWRFLGTRMRENEFESLIWYPKRSTHRKPANTHVNHQAYQERWRQEIAAIGGYDKLTDAHELLIRYSLVQEFHIDGLRAPTPGGHEWLAMELPWPLIPSKDQ